MINFRRMGVAKLAFRSPELLDSIRRVFGLHLHQWEVVGSRQAGIDRAALPGGGPNRGASLTSEPLDHVTVEIVTFKCKTCGKERESGGGLH